MEKCGPYVEVFGRAVGVAAGLVGAWHDFKQFQSERKAGHGALAWLHFGSATASLLLCVATIAEATVLILPPILVLIVNGILIARKVHHEIDEWISKYVFGTGDEKLSAQD